MGVLSSMAGGGAVPEADWRRLSWCCCWRIIWRRRFCLGVWVSFGVCEERGKKKQSWPSTRGEGQTYYLSFLLLLNLLVNLSQAWGSLMMWISLCYHGAASQRARTYTPKDPRSALSGLHLAGAGDGGVVDGQVHEDARAATFGTHCLR